MSGIISLIKTYLKDRNKTGFVQIINSLQAELNEAREVIGFYGDKVKTWDYEKVARNDWESFWDEDGNEWTYGGKYAREHQKKWEKA